MTAIDGEIGQRALSFIGSLKGRSVASSLDLSADETRQVLDAAIALKRLGRVTHFPLPLQGQCLAMIFEKPSCRTRVTFEVGMVQLGGHPIHLTQADIGLGTRETVPDIARNLSRWVQGIVARTFSHQTVLDLIEYSTVPVINALSDQEHPCQALADFMTIQEHAGSAAGFKLAWVGDGNNVCNSLMLTGARLGAHLRVAAPEGYAPDSEIVAAAQHEAVSTGGSIRLFSDPAEAVEGADGIYTDVWTSMGQEAERERRLRDFAGFQVNAALLSRARPGALVLHCLPAHRDEEITADVLEGPQSVVFDEAENRLHAQKALLAMTLGNAVGQG